MLENERLSDRLSWIKDLVRNEQRMEETGVAEAQRTDREYVMAAQTLRFMEEIKQKLVESTDIFNQLKPSPLNRVKIYGIANTPADFMLFRNGYKMIFAMKAPGQIAIRFNFFGPAMIPKEIPQVSSAAQTITEEELLEAKMAAFGDLKWTYNGDTVALDSLVKYHFTLFIHESAR